MEAEWLPLGPSDMDLEKLCRMIEAGDVSWFWPRRGQDED